MQLKKNYIVGGLLLAVGLGVLIAGVILGSPALTGGAAAFLVLTIGCALTARRRAHPYLV
jgi:hypothetical protein